jgi:hypothetical protein
MEDHELSSHALCKEALRQAEHACAVVGDLFGKGPVAGAQPAMEVAVRFKQGFGLLGEIATCIRRRDP